MKKTRLLEIIREEIAFALSEVNPTIGLEEEQLDEMAFSLKKGIAPSEKIEPRYKKENFKKVVDLILSKVDGKKTTADIARELGIIQQKINPVVSDLLIAGILEKGEAESKAGKDAVNKPGPKAKVKEEPKAKKEKAEKPAKEKPESKSKSKPKDEDEDDELEKADKAYYSSEEDETPTEKAPVGDKGMEQKARKQDELIKQYREVMDTYKSKKEEEGDESAKEYLKSKQDIVQKYLKMKKVKA